MRKSGVLFLLSLFILPAFGAGADDWEPIGPYGGDFTKIAISPSDPNILYIGTMRGGLFRTVDSGNLWERAGLTGDRISSIAIDTGNPEIVYVSRIVNQGQSTTLKTEDGGDTWREIGAFSRTVAASPTQSGLVFACSNGGLFKSMDGGDKFEKIEYDFGINNYPVLVFDTIQPETMYMGTDDAIYKSTDTGDHWQKLSDFLDNFDGLVVTCISISPLNDSKIVLGILHGGNGGIYASEDAGLHWENRGIYCSVNAVFCGSDDENSILCGLSCGYAKSDDFGRTWKRIEGFSVAGGAAKNNTVYLLDENKGMIFLSEDWGKTWRPSADGVSNTSIESMVLNNNGDLTALQSTGYSRILLKHDGSDWDTLNYDRNFDFGNKLYQNENNGHIYAIDGWNAFSWSDDSGISWERRGIGLPYSAQEALAVWGDTLLIACSTDFEGLDGGIYKSNDEGAGWFISSEGLPLVERMHLGNTQMAPIDVYSLCMDPANTKILYAGVYEELYKSTDSGGKWSKSGTIPNGVIRQLIVDPDSSAVVYAITDKYYTNLSKPRFDSLFISRDEGVSFAPVNTGLQETKCLFHDDDKGHLFAGGSNGVVRSKDRGLNWEIVGDMQKNVTVVCIEKGKDDFIFAGTEEGGIYKLHFLDTGVSGRTESAPAIFRIYPNYPNPFNPSTTVRYSVKKGSDISIRICNLLGETVRTFHNGYRAAGDYQIIWNGRDDQGNFVDSGIYLFHITCGDGTVTTRKMVLAR
jgi:photosystem II stability/assembly factor-like uncharacterized protein